MFLTDDVQLRLAQLRPMMEGSGPPAGGTAPEASQGDGGSGGTSGLYDLSEIPEEYRQHVEPHFKQWDANVTKRFQGLNEQIGAWKPYDELGLRDYDPDTLSDLLDFADMAQNEEQFKGWLKQQAEQFGLLGEQSGEGASDLDELADQHGVTPEQIKEMLQAEIAPLREHIGKQQAAQAEAEESARLDARLEELTKEAGIELSDEDVEDVYTFALAFEDDKDPMGKGFERWQSRRGAVEKGVVERRLGRPTTPEGPGGRPATGEESPRNFRDADKMARERLALLRST